MLIILGGGKEYAITSFLQYLCKILHNLHWAMPQHAGAKGAKINDHGIV